MRKLIIAVVLSLALCGQAFAAGSSITWARTATISRGNKVRTVVTATLTSDDGTGAVTGTDTGYAYYGYLMECQTAPGSPAPGTAWTLTAIDHVGGADMLGGQGTGLSTSAGQYVPDANGNKTLAVPINGTLTLTAGTMGNDKKATARFVIEE